MNDNRMMISPLSDNPKIRAIQLQFRDNDIAMSRTHLELNWLDDNGFQGMTWEERGILMLTQADLMFEQGVCTYEHYQQMKATDERLAIRGGDIVGGEA